MTPRGYIPVYEYPLNSQWIMMDIDDGYILWTGIWKALGNSKADIVKMIDSQPELAQVIRRVRGGYLKIQGTWMPFEVRSPTGTTSRMEYTEDLIPLFGPTFPSTMLVPRPTWLRPSGSVYWSPEGAPERTAASYAHDPRARQ
ncbi:transcription regulator HTH, apses-type DNA-binding domain-containing protein [Mycena olivaceomarginata]|nr:transcription regulator HTH, apses-type DNA-binding domain-containing protein [Mycena olivaceomarginata]